MRQHKRRGPRREQHEVTVPQPRTDASPLMAVSLAAAATGDLEADKKPSSEASGTSHCKYLTGIRQGARAGRCCQPPCSRDHPVPTAGSSPGRRGGRARKRCKLDTKHTSGGAVTSKRRSRGRVFRKETEVIQITSLLSLSLLRFLCPALLLQSPPRRTSRLPWAPGTHKAATRARARSLHQTSCRSAASPSPCNSSSSAWGTRMTTAPPGRNAVLSLGAVVLGWSDQERQTLRFGEARPRSPSKQRFSRNQLSQFQGTLSRHGIKHPHSSPHLKQCNPSLSVTCCNKHYFFPGLTAPCILLHKPRSPIQAIPALQAAASPFSRHKKSKKSKKP